VIFVIMTRVPDDSLETTESAQGRWERLPGGPLLGLALGVAVSAAFWLLTLVLASELMR